MTDPLQSSAVIPYPVLLNDKLEDTVELLINSEIPWEPLVPTLLETTVEHGVVDIEMPKALPTNEIAINTKPYEQHQEEWMVEKINQLPQIKLPEGQGIPVNAK